VPSGILTNCERSQLGLCAASFINDYYQRQRDSDLKHLTDQQISQLFREISDKPDPVRDQLINEQIKRWVEANKQKEQARSIVQPAATPWSPGHVELTPPVHVEHALPVRLPAHAALP
jgi:hypothetical protein